MFSHKDIEDQAAVWLAQRDSGEWSDADQARLGQWLEAATANRVAFLRLESAWEEARRLKALGAGIPKGTVPPPNEWRQTAFFKSNDADDQRSVSATSVGRRKVRSRRTAWIRYGVAASFILALALGTYVALSTRGDQYSTPVGEVATVPLKDGSSITLNAASAVWVDLSRKERRINLERGEAFFAVAKDPKRPFVVEAGNKRVIAVGTRFAVRREGDEVRVVVTEGTVKLEAVGHALHLSGTGAAAAVKEFASLTAGTIARATEDDVLIQERSIAVAEAALSWRRETYLSFHETTLAEAVQEFNRYNTHKITIDDPRVAAIRISGTFRPTDYQAFVRLLHEAYGIPYKSTDGEITLVTH